MSQHSRGWDEFLDDSENPHISGLLRQLHTSGPPGLRLDFGRETGGFSSTRDLLASFLRTLAAREVASAAGRGSLFSPLPPISPARRLREEIRKLLDASGGGVPRKTREALLAGIGPSGAFAALARAQTLLAESRSLQPSSPFREWVEGRLLHQRHDWPEAEKAFRRLSQSEESDASYFARLDLVSLLLQSGRLEEARALSADTKSYGTYGRMPLRHAIASLLLGNVQDGSTSLRVVEEKARHQLRSCREFRLFLVHHTGPFAQLLRRSPSLRSTLTAAAPTLFHPSVLSALARPLPMPPSRLRSAIRTMEEFRNEPSCADGLRRILSFLDADLVAWFVLEEPNAGARSLRLEVVEGDPSLVEAAKKRWKEFVETGMREGRALADCLRTDKSRMRLGLEKDRKEDFLASPQARSQVLIPVGRSDDEMQGALVFESRGLLAPTREDLFFAEEIARRVLRPMRRAKVAPAEKIGPTSVGGSLDSFPDFAKRRFGVPLDLRISGYALRALLKDLAVAAGSRAPILLLGESGSGKEVLARYAHFESALREGPFIAFNCNAVPSELVESELFGHIKGSFTGAERDRVGLFEVAEGGTLLLDEIGDLKPEVQGKLLRVLQEGTFRRVGDAREIRFTGRIVAATHRPLKDLLPKGEFREDLFHRINRFAFSIPPLRARRDELLPLSRLLLRRFAEEEGREDLELLSDADAWIWRQEWPGNVRALENFLYKLALFYPGESVGEKELSETARKFDLPYVEKINPREANKDLVQMAIASVPLFDGKPNLSQASLLLGWDRATLKAKLTEFGMLS